MSQVLSRPTQHNSELNLTDRWHHPSGSFRAGRGRRDVTGPRRADGTDRGIGHKREQRFLTGGYLGRLGDCQGVKHPVGPPLPFSRLTADIINAVAGRLPLSVRRPAHPETLDLQVPRVKPSPRPSENVRSSETTPIASGASPIHWRIQAARAYEASHNQRRCFRSPGIHSFRYQLVRIVSSWRSVRGN